MVGEARIPTNYLIARAPDCTLIFSLGPMYVCFNIPLYLMLIDLWHRSMA